MTYRKRPFSFYQQKLKAVFVLLGIVFLFYFKFPHSDTTKTQLQLYGETTTHYSNKLDSLLAASKKPLQKLAPFHPNFTTSYRAYRLGLPSAVADSVAAYHKAGKWIASKEEYQKVTGLADSSYNRIASYLKYPEKRKERHFKSPAIVKQDLNKATAVELQKVRGLGIVLSNRILNYKDRIQAYSSLEQLGEVYGLSPEVRSLIAVYFEIRKPVPIQSKPFSTATLSTLAAQPYLTYEQARWLVKERTQKPYKSLEVLLEDSGWDSLQVQRIKLYLY